MGQKGRGRVGLRRRQTANKQKYKLSSSGHIENSNGNDDDSQAKSSRGRNYDDAAETTSASFRSRTTAGVAQDSNSTKGNSFSDTIVSRDQIETSQSFESSGGEELDSNTAPPLPPRNGQNLSMHNSNAQNSIKEKEIKRRLENSGSRQRLLEKRWKDN